MYGKKKYVAAAVAAAALCGAAVIVLRGDALIVAYGIRAYRAVRGAACILAGITSGAAAVSFIGAAREKRMLLEAKAEFEKKKEEAGRIPAILSMKGKLDSGKLREIMRRQVSGDWEMFEEEGSECIAQMEQMDEYREKLHLLLADNDAGRLSDSESVLDRAEQYICRNVRKVLNYMSVAGDGEEDAELVGNGIRECLEKNGEQLERVKKFVYAMAEYLNHQGDDDTVVRTLEAYRETILSTITEEEG